MRCFYAPETEAHDPVFRLPHGKIQRNAERAEREHLLLARLGRVSFDTDVPPEAPCLALEALHTPRFLDCLESARDDWQALSNAGPEAVPNVFPRAPNARYPESVVGRLGWHMGDTSAPIGPHSWRATRRTADCAVAAADAVLDGARHVHALTRPAGHHTTADIAAGHCLLNVSAIAAARLRTGHARVAVLDMDVHHGDGTQGIFYDRDDVLTVSIHADPTSCYPFFTGYADQTGTGAGDGFNLNFPLPLTTKDEAWLAALADGIARVQASEPGARTLSLGLDAHENDPLKGMKMSWDGLRRAGAMIAAAGLPTVLVQEGGYLTEDLTTSLVSFLTGFLGR